jgi:hypothetical protein
MRTLAQLLDRIPLAAGPEAPPPTPEAGADLLRDLGAGLPQGHMQLWGGPEGSGKSAFLLALLHGAALRGRGAYYATYDLPAPTLAARLLAMVAGVPVEALPDPGTAPSAGRLDADGLARARGARTRLAKLPFVFEEARGFGVTSLEDRLVRLPFRPGVCAVDYVQAVVRPAGQDLGGGVRALAALAAHHHLAILAAVRPVASEPGHELAAVEELARHATPDRVGWLEPAAQGGAREGRLLANRHGGLSRVPLAVDPASGHVSRRST